MGAHSVSPIYGGKTTVQLINPTPVPVTLYSQEKIGKLSFFAGSGHGEAGRTIIG